MKNENVNNDKNNEFIESEILLIEDEAGSQFEFYLVATLQYKDDWYVCLEPTELTEGIEDGEILILEVKSDEEGNDLFVTVENEKIIQEVFSEFLKMQEEYDQA
ncbi:MAG: DUF1292 domain-containing protein [Christensenellales bacterium]|jgi:hypothetical protein|nr:DUF1292 domain-containing protein [Clostridiales bacterium]